MIITTTNTIEGRKIRKYLSVVNANVVIGTNVFSDIAASFTDIFGGRSESYRGKLELMYNEVMLDLKERASNLLADAIVGVSINFDEISGKDKSMFMVSASGTAVTLEPEEEDRYRMYDMLDRIIRYREKGIITEEEFEHEKKMITSMNSSAISSEVEEEKKEKERLKKEQEQKEELIRIAKESLKNRENASIDDITKIDEYMIEASSYDDIEYNPEEQMQYTIARFIRLKRIPEACKFYMDETGLTDAKAAIDFCTGICRKIDEVDDEKVAAIIPKLKVLRKRGFMEQAIAEYQKLTFSDRKTAEDFIMSLEI